MFSSKNPNRDLAYQQSVFGTRMAPEPTLMERLKSRFARKPAPPPQKEEDLVGPAGEIIRNALFTDLTELEPDLAVIANPTPEMKLPKEFVVISLVEQDPDAVQVELFMENLSDARFKLLQITSRIERGQAPQASMEGLFLKSDRVIVHHPTLPGRDCAVCRIKPGKKHALA